MKKILRNTIAALALVTPLAAGAQNLHFGTDTDKRSYVLTSADTVRLNFDNDFKTVAVAGNTDFTATTDASWLTLRKEAGGGLTLFGHYNYESSGLRTADVTLSSADGNFSRKLVVEQAPNQAALSLKGDTKHEIRTATASQSQGGEGIERSYDDNVSTLYHSPYGGGTTFPVTLTYTLKTASHVDYALYTTRQDGQSNGNFQEVEVLYALSTAANTFVSLGTFNFGGDRGSFRMNFGDKGIDKVSKVRFVVKSGAGNFASCAEMGFYENNNELKECLDTYFADALCTQLKPGVTEETLPEISVPYARQLAYNLLQGDYSTKYRVGEYEPYRSLASLAAELKTTQYNRYENPTGIYFRKGEPVVAFVEGITDVSPSLIIKSFGPESYEGEGQPESSYPLHNGVNLIVPANRGNGYVSYYSDAWATLPNVRVHFAMATENGYFDAQRGDTNEDWVELLANATSDIIDIRSQRLQAAIPTATLRQVCPRKGVELAEIHNQIIFREREIMGLALFGREPKNRQFARCVPSGMFADGVGAAAAFGSIGEWANPDNFGFWGMGHELGHVNQVRPGFKWVGCGETTNNVYSAWVEHTLGTGYHRLEDEHSGIDDYKGMRGGRFEAYLEEGVRKGVAWQLQDGPDYHGTTPSEITVTGQDANGNATGTVTTTSRNYDHFLKVVPLWQLELYCLQAGKAPDAYGKMLEAVRKDNTQRTNGQYQIEFMRTFCDSTQINFLPFFEKAGLLKPIHAYIEDYSPGWNIIDEAMIKELTDYVESKNYAKAPEALNYINAYNWQTFRDGGRIDETTAVGTGCTYSSSIVTVDNEAWKNAVGYETYDANGNLLRITMFGLGDNQQSSRYTKVLFPLSSSERSSYIMAVGPDGQRVKCYQR